MSLSGGLAIGQLKRHPNAVQLMQWNGQIDKYKLDLVAFRFYLMYNLSV